MKNEKCHWCKNNGGLHLNTSILLYEPIQCGVCLKVASQKYANKINKKLLERNRGFGYNRTTYVHGIREKLFYEMWHKINVEKRGFNGGQTALQLLISNTLQNSIMSGLQKRIPKDEIATERDYKIAATVVQWLGSSVGYSYLKEVVQKIEEMEEK